MIRRVAELEVMATVWTPPTTTSRSRASNVLALRGVGQDIFGYRDVDQFWLEAIKTETLLWHRTAAELKSLCNAGYTFVVLYSVIDECDPAELPSIQEVVAMPCVEVVEVRIRDI